MDIGYLRRCLIYDPVSGVIVWCNRPREHFDSTRGWKYFNSRFAGKPAGTLSNTTGYITINFNGQMFASHRVIWALETGIWPEAHIDHIDGNRSNNTWSNLRICERWQNQCNRPMQVNNRSGFKGVYLHSEGRWRSRIQRRGVTTDLGLFSTPEAAHAAYSIAAKQLHGEFAKTN